MSESGGGRGGGAACVCVGVCVCVCVCGCVFVVVLYLEGALLCYSPFVMNGGVNGNTKANSWCDFTFGE